MSMHINDVDYMYKCDTLLHGNLQWAQLFGKWMPRERGAAEENNALKRWLKGTIHSELRHEMQAKSLLLATDELQFMVLAALAEDNKEDRRHCKHQPRDNGNFLHLCTGDEVQTVHN